MTRFFILLLALLLPPALAQAESCTKPTSVMLLQNADEKRLQLARSLKEYLKSQNLNGQLATAIYSWQSAVLLSLRLPLLFPG